MMKSYVNKGLITLLVLVTLLAVAVQVLPFLAIKWATDWYQTQGEGYELSIGDWQFSLLRLNLSVQDVVFTHPDLREPASTIKNIAIDVDPKTLMDQVIYIRSIHIDSPELTVSVNQQISAAAQTNIVGIKLPLAKGDSASNTITAADTVEDTEQQSAKEAPQDSQQEDSQAPETPWQVILENVIVEKHRLAWEHRENDQQRAGQLDLDRLQVNNLNPVSNQAFQLLATHLALTLDSGSRYSFNQLQLDKLSKTDDLIDLEQLNLLGVNLLHDAKNSVSVERYTLDHLQFGLEKLTIGPQTYQGLQLAVERNPAPAQADAVPQTATSIEASPDSAAQTQPTFIKTLTFGGFNQDASALEQKPGIIRFVDTTVEPVFKTDFRIHQLSIKPAEIHFTGKALERTETLEFEIVAGLDEYNKITLSGLMGLTQLKGEYYPEGQMTLSVKQLNLVPFNGYLNQAIGYHANKGMVESDGIIKVSGGKLSGDIKLLVRNSKFEPADQATIKRYSKKISMPLDTALDLLRDDKGNIVLTIPISGDITSPEFGFDDLTSQLSKLALQKGALYYLQQSLQPYTLMISLATYAGEYLMAVRLDALTFPENQAELSPNHMDRIKKVASMMRKKTELELSVCPFVNQNEAKESDWKSLAQARSQAVKAELAKVNDKAGVSLSARVTLCKEQIGKQPEVVLGIQ